MANLVRITLNTSFTWPTTFGRKHHFPPYNILYVFPQGLHPNVIFPQDSQNWDYYSFKIGTFSVPKFWMLIYFSNQVLKNNIKVISYSLLKRSFQWCITRPNQTSFDHCIQGICGRKSNSQFDSCPFF